MATRRLLSVLALLALVCPAGVALAPAAGAAVQVTRIAGDDRYATSAAVSRSTFPTDVPVAVIAAGRRFPDALAGGPAARKLGGPLLLSQRSAVPDAVVEELSRLRPGRIVLLGGLDALGQSTEAQVAKLTAGSVTRLQGGDRFDTAAAISAGTFPPEPPVAFVVSGLDFPDAIVAGAAGAGAGGPVLLTAPDALPVQTRTELRRLRPRSIVVVGGPAAVNAAVLTELETFAPVRRVAGADRYATGAALAAHLFPNGVERIYVAAGDTFPDALSGAPPAGFLPSPLILVPSGDVGDLPSEVRVEIRRLHPTQVVVLGGTAAVGTGMADQVAAAASGDDGPAPTTNLVVTAVSSPPTSAVQGDSFPVNDEVRNTGTTTAGPSSASFLLSPDGTVASAVELSGTRAVETLAPGSVSIGTTTVTVPTAVAPGTYRLLGCADRADAVRETSESDNCTVADGQITVSAPGGGGGGGGGGTVGPNLVVTALSSSASSTSAGGTIPVDDEVTNVGDSRSSASVVAFTLSTDQVPSAEDVKIGQREVADLGSATPSSGRTVATVPAATPPGTYTLVACADAGKLVSETSETDNCRIGPAVTVS